MSSSRQQLREKSQDFAVRYHEALEADDYELAEKLTLEHLHLIDEYVLDARIEELKKCRKYYGKPASSGLTRRINKLVAERRRAGIGEK